MTAKDKAKELLDRFMMYDVQVTDFMGCELDGYIKRHQKNCALICIDEIISIDTHPTDGRYTNVGKFYKEVREELLKL